MQSARCGIMGHTLEKLQGEQIAKANAGETAVPDIGDGTPIGMFYAGLANCIFCSKIVGETGICIYNRGFVSIGQCVHAVRY